MACIHVACVGFVFSALSYSKCSQSFRKQRSEELRPANSSPAAVWQRSSQLGCEMMEQSQQSSSTDSVTDSNSSPAVMNSTAAANVSSRQSSGHSHVCSLDEHSNLLKPSEGSVALSTDISPHVYVV